VQCSVNEVQWCKWQREGRELRAETWVSTFSPTTKIFVLKIKTHQRTSVDTIPSLPFQAPT